MTMQRTRWVSVILKVPKLFIFAFGVALISVILASVGALVFAGSSYTNSPNFERWVFGSTFVVSLIFLLAKDLLRKNDRLG